MSNTQELRTCLCCNSKKLVPYLDLGKQPLANNYHKGEKQETYPLGVQVCETCFHSQLAHTVDNRLLFHNYIYVSGTSETLNRYFRGFCQMVMMNWKGKQPPRVLELACFPEATILAEGYTPQDISQIGIGDRVLSQDGSFTEVVRRYERHFEGELVCIKVTGTSGVIRMTPEHPVAIIRRNPAIRGAVENQVYRDNQQIEWVEAKDIQRGDFCVLPQNLQRRADLTELDLAEWVECWEEQEAIYPTQMYRGRICKAHCAKAIPRYLILDEEIGRLLGYYISEGSSRGSKKNCISFSLCSDELAIVDDIRDILKRRFGLESTVERGAGKSISVRSNSTVMCRLLQAWCGEDAHSKKIPTWAFNTSEAFLRGLVEGAYAGDGSNTSGQTKYDTVSIILAHQIKYLLHCFGIRGSLVPNKPSGYGKDNGTTLYSVRTYDREGRKRLTEMVEGWPSTADNSGVSCVRRPESQGYLLLPVLDTEKQPFSGMVYNLETENHTYVVDSFVVHNCNDGTLLDMFRQRGCAVVGVDPAQNLANLCHDWDLTVWPDYWNLEVAAKVKEIHGKFDVVIAVNVLPHVPNPQEFMEACKLVLDPAAVKQGGGIYVQTSQCDWLQKGEFDVVYHEHSSYFTVSSFGTLAYGSGLEVKEASKVPIHGKSFLFRLGPMSGDGHCDAVFDMLEEENSGGWHTVEQYQQWSQEVERKKEAFRLLANLYRDDGYLLVGYGASAKANTVLNYFGISLDAMVDDNPLKCRLLTPGTNVPILSPEDLNLSSPVAWVMTSWNFKVEIVQKIRKLRAHYSGPEFILSYIPDVEAEPLFAYGKSD